MHRISDIRMGGISRRNFSMFRRLCGDETLKNVVVCTTRWDLVSREEGVKREEELESEDDFFKPVLDKGAALIRHDNGRRSAETIIHHLLRTPPKALQIQTQLVDQRMDITETDAGAELQAALLAQAEKYKMEIASLQQEMREALAAKDTQAKEELDQVRRELHGALKRVQDDHERLSHEFRELRVSEQAHSRQDTKPETPSAASAEQPPAYSAEDGLVQRALGRLDRLAQTAKQIHQEVTGQAPPVQLEVTGPAKGKGKSGKQAGIEWSSGVGLLGTRLGWKFGVKVGTGENAGSSDA